MYLLARRAARWSEKGVAGAVGCTGRESEVASALNESLINRYTPYIDSRRVLAIERGREERILGLTGPGASVVRVTLRAWDSLGIDPRVE